MLSSLILGLLLGLQHALEADHLAAVASLSSRSTGLREAARHGLSWGLGHSLSLLLFGGAVLLLGGAIAPHLALVLESAVGLMLIVLGGDVLRRLWQRRVHFHVHSHGAERHFHAHSHAPGGDHASDPHRHEHAKRLPLRSLLVGMMHGLAGTAALIMLTLGSVQSVWQGLAYIAIFGLGSMLGMALLVVVISVPLRWSAHGLAGLHQGLTAVLGLLTIGIGGVLLQQTGGQLLAELGGI
jgi:ABC-type nickel/cobalt efflux system permease component RcnA